MGKILPGRLSRLILLLSFAVFLVSGSPAPAPAQEDPSLPADKAVEYRTYISSGERYLEEGRYREAIAEFNRALLLYPGSDDAKKGIIKANQAIAARSTAPDAVDIESERINFHLTKGTEYYEEAVEKYNLDLLAQAVAEWEQVLQIEPENKLANSLIQAANRAKVDLLIENGHDEFFNGNIKEAIAIWEEARTLAPASKVLDDLIFQANQQFHDSEMEDIADEFMVESYDMQEYTSRSGLVPKEMGQDGIKRKDSSLRPPTGILVQLGEKQAIVKELSQPVAFEFECEPLRGVLKFLTEITGINILVDEAIFEEFGSEEDCYKNKVDRKEIFVTIHVSELPLESALNGMLRQHGLGFSIERDFIYVSTPDVLRGSSFEQLETRFYHLRDTSRIALPKVETSGGGTSVTLGGKALDITSSQSMVARLKEIQGNKLQEVDPDYESMSVPKLINLLRTFIPVVLDQSKQKEKRVARVGDDKQYGGFESGSDQIKLFESPRQLWADAGGREILSLIDFDPVTNTLIVRNTPSNLDMVETFLENFDQPPRQVAIEAKFIKYSISEAEKVGIEFQASALWETDSISEGSITELDVLTDILLPAATQTGGGDIFFRFTKADGDFLDLTINLLTEMSSSRIVSAPRLVTMSNKPAVIQDVTIESFRTNIEIDTNIVTSEGGGTTTITDITQEFTDITAGITLSVTPQIQYDNTIRLFIMPDVSTLGTPKEFDLNFPVEGGTSVNTITRPVVFRQSLFSNVVVNDGDTIVVGGLIEDANVYARSGVPFLKDIPLIGRIFENEVRVSDGQNLLIFITVNILDPQGIAYTRLK